MNIKSEEQVSKMSLEIRCFIAWLITVLVTQIIVSILNGFWLGVATFTALISVRYAIGEAILINKRNQ